MAPSTSLYRMTIAHACSDDVHLRGCLARGRLRVGGRRRRLRTRRRRRGVEGVRASGAAPRCMTVTRVIARSPRDPVALLPPCHRCLLPGTRSASPGRKIAGHGAGASITHRGPTRRSARARPGLTPTPNRGRRHRDWETAAVLNQAIGDLLPAAAAVALSPIPIVAIVLVLHSPRRPGERAGVRAGMGGRARGRERARRGRRRGRQRSRQRCRQRGQLGHHGDRRPLPRDGRRSVEEATHERARHAKMPSWMATIESVSWTKAARARRGALRGQPEERGAHAGRVGVHRPERDSTGPTRHSPSRPSSRSGR